MLRKSPGGARMGAVSPPSAAQSSARSVRAVVAGALLVAALGAAPRALALAAIGYAAPHAPLPQALFDFKSTWGACKKPGAVFTGYSPGGQLYRWLILTDHCFYSLGLTVAYLGGLHALFPAKTHDAREAPAQPFGVRLWRGLRRLFCLLGVINFCVWMAIDAQLYRGDMTNAQVCARALACGCHRLISGRASLHAPQQCLQQCFLALIHRLLARIQVELSHVILDRFLYSVAGLFVVAFFVLTTSQAALRRVAEPKSQRVTCFRRGQFSFYFSCIIALSFYFCLIPSGLRVKLLLELGDLRFVVMQLTVSKLLIWALRSVALTHLDLVDTATLQSINIVSFVVTVTVSLQIRARWGVLIDRVEGGAASVLWNTCGISTLICLVEMCTCLLACSFNVWLSSTKFKRIHVQTLGDVIKLHDDYQTRQILFYGQHLVEELAEVYVCGALALQALATPVWTLCAATWSGSMTLSHFRGERFAIVFAQLGIRLLFELGSVCIIVLVFKGTVPVDISAVLRQLASRPMVLFVIGVMISQPVAFWPISQLCSNNACSVLLFNECLLRSVHLDGRDACQPRFRWTTRAAVDLMNQTNMTEDDLGCSLVSNATLLAGLRWKQVESAELHTCAEIKNAALARALQETVYFSQQDLDKLNARGLSDDSCIKVQDTYFKPTARRNCVEDYFLHY